MKALNHFRWGATIAVAILLHACAPMGVVAPIVASALGGGEASTSKLSGPFAGTASPAQNARRNGDIADEALSQIEDEPRAICRGKLPPADEATPEGCRLRQTCLPGGIRPIWLRVCPRPEGGFEATKGGTGDRWSWNEEAAVR